MKQALSGAFDMLSHSMETYFGTPHDNNLSDLIAEANMRCIIDSTRKMIAAPEDLAPRSELFWASAMAENGILKIGKATAFQAHMIEHQLGAYTDCNHGFGLAVIHPTMYRHMMGGAPEKFARFATEVWGVEAEGKTVDELAAAGARRVRAPALSPSHAREASLTQGLVEHDGNGVGEVERADAVVLGVDEVAADVPGEKGGMVAPLARSAPALRVLERRRVWQHGDALAAVRVIGEQRLRQPHALAPKDEEVAVSVRGLGVGAPRLLGEEVQPCLGAGEAALLDELVPVCVHGHVEALPVPEARAPEGALVQREAERPHEVQARARDYARASYVPRVGRYLRRHEHDVEHVRLPRPRLRPAIIA